MYLRCSQLEHMQKNPPVEVTLRLSFLSRVLRHQAKYKDLTTVHCTKSFHRLRQLDCATEMRVTQRGSTWR